VANKCVEDQDYECPEGTKRGSRGCVSPTGSGFSAFINPVNIPSFPGVIPSRFPTTYAPEFKGIGSLLGSEITVLENNLNEFKNMRITVPDLYNNQGSEWNNSQSNYGQTNNGQSNNSQWNNGQSNNSQWNNTQQ
jgi:hypothetical protein